MRENAWGGAVQKAGTGNWLGSCTVPCPLWRAVSLFVCNSSFGPMVCKLPGCF